MADMKNLMNGEELNDEELDMVVGGAGTLYVMKVRDAAGNVVKYNAVGVDGTVSELVMSSLKSGAIDKLKADGGLMLYDGVKASRWNKALDKAASAGFTTVKYLN